MSLDSKFLHKSPAQGEVQGLSQGSFDRTFEIARSAVTNYLIQFLSPDGCYRHLGSTVSSVPIHYSTDPLDAGDAQRLSIRRMSETLKKHLPCILIMSDGSLEHKSAGIGGVTRGFYSSQLGRRVAAVGGGLIELNLTLIVASHGQTDRNQLQNFVSRALVDLMPFTSNFVLSPKITDQVGSWQVVLPSTLSWSLDEGESREGGDTRKQFYTATTSLRVLVEDIQYLDMGEPIKLEQQPDVQLQPVLPSTVSIGGPTLRIKWGYRVLYGREQDAGTIDDDPQNLYEDLTSLKVWDSSSTFKVSDARRLMIGPGPDFRLRPRKPGTVQVYWYKNSELLGTYDITITR